jgi:hypothetical protein
MHSSEDGFFGAVGARIHALRSSLLIVPRIRFRCHRLCDNAAVAGYVGDRGQPRAPGAASFNG